MAPADGSCAGDDDARIERERIAEYGHSLGPLVITGRDLLEDEPERPAMVHGIADKGEVVLLQGPEKDSYKTWLALLLGLCTLSGKPWLGRPVTAQSGRILIVTETRAREIKRRLRLLARGMDIDLAAIANRIVIVTDRITLLPSAELLGVRDRAYLNAKRTRDMASKGKTVLDPDAAANAAVNNLGTRVLAGHDISKNEWALVVVDTVRCALKGDENSSADMQAFVDAVREIAECADALVVCIHHTNKSGAAGEVRSSRGSTALTAGVDTILAIDASKSECTLHMTARERESLEPIAYRLVVDDAGARIEVTEPSEADTAEKVLTLLRAAVKPMSANALRKPARASGTTMERVLTALLKTQQVAMTKKGDRKLWSYNPSFSEVAR